MYRRLPLLVRAIAYEMRGGFLVRPFLVALGLGLLGAMLSSLEAHAPQIRAFVPTILFPSQKDPQTAGLILSSIATSIMTVVSVVFAILLMTLTLASTQFSPRILVSFVRDRATQWTLGVLLGAFSYCIAVLASVRSLPQPFVPVLSVTVAMILALVAVAWLIFFIHHISQAISVNHIVDRIARDTELIIEGLMPHPWTGVAIDETPLMAKDEGWAMASPRSGYIRFIDVGRLAALAKEWRIRIRVVRGVGQFTPAGAPLVRITRQAQVSPLRAEELMGAFDIGATRTLQQDLEFGVIQIVDIALRAISPAVNDPSTAISCIDQLSTILILWCARTPPASILADPPHVPRVEVPWIGLEGLFSTAFDQIRHYAAADLAVNLRLLRAMGEIAASTTRTDVHAALRRRARLVVETATRAMVGPDAERLRARLAGIEADLAG